MGGLIRKLRKLSRNTRGKVQTGDLVHKKVHGRKGERQSLAGWRQATDRTIDPTASETTHFGFCCNVATK
jgi:hypothetical protein